jgi:hypothetical protein
MIWKNSPRNYDHMARTETALQLRNHALAILRREDSYQPIGDARFLMWNGENFGMWLRTSFKQWETGLDVAANPQRSQASGSTIFERRSF